MKIGIISDTHDAHENILKAINILNEYQVKYVLHAGDIVSPFAAKAFADVKGAKFIAVFGNNEGEKLLLKSTVEEFDGEIHDYTYKGEIGGRKIFMTHVPTSISEIIESEKYDLIVYGHTHQKDICQAGKTLVINPGEATDWISGRATLVILETEDMSYEVVTIS